jgi:excisionase family DNA binding protein
MPGEPLDIKGAAEMLGVKPSTIRAWCLRRKLRYFKSGRCVRFKRDWLEAFIERNTTTEVPNRPRA